MSDIDADEVDTISREPASPLYETEFIYNSLVTSGNETGHTEASKSVNERQPFNFSCFEFTDMNRQTSWITIYDGRGVFAENVNLLILVRDKNIVWVDVEVDCIRFPKANK